jgi:protein O-GlcNAc transferase
MIELSTNQAFDAAVQFHRDGKTADAEALYRQVLAQEPRHDQAMHLLGLLASQAGRQEEALELIERALALNPLSAEYRTNRGVILQALGQTSDAIADFIQALTLQPNLTDAQINLGHALSSQARWKEAAAAYRVALLDRRELSSLHNDLGIALYNLGQLDDAIAAFKQAIQLQPDDAHAQNNLGNALFLKGELGQAIAAYRQAVETAPQLIDAKINLANALDQQGRPEEGLKLHLAVAHARPEHAPTHDAVGDAHFLQRRWDEAVNSYRQAAELDPDNPAAHARLGDALLAKMDLDAAAGAYRRAVALRPDFAEALNNLGVVLKEQGRLDEAIDCYDKALAIRPDDAAIDSNRVYFLSFHHAYDPPALASEQRRWNRLHAQPLKSSFEPHPNDRSPDRKLRIGYVSPDFKQHVVGQSILPLLSEHDHQAFEIYCYSAAAREDAFTDLLRPHANVWRNVASLSDVELANIIREDQIDILIDLSLHMAHNRLMVFARKPAPVQATYLGYCASTGLDAIDYRFSDPHLDPTETDLAIYSEETIRLPETYWCYRCAGPTPQPSPPPSERTGFITFGCLNNFAKISPPAMDLWAQILQAVPNSRLILHAYPGSHIDAAQQRFAAAGISSDRLEFLPKQPWAQYVQTYNRIDIALDPFPWAGGITTCDALWMGVPIVTLSGDTAVGRGGRSILSNLALPELIARRPRQYVQTAISLSQSPQRLTDLRQTLRQRMLASPLMNARRFTRNVETACKQIWRRWCDSRT